MKSLDATVKLTPQPHSSDLRLRVFQLQAAASRLSKAEVQLVGVVLFAALGAGGFWALVGGSTSRCPIVRACTICVLC